MPASKGKKNRQTESNTSIIEEIKQDNIKAARKQQSKNIRQIMVCKASDFIYVWRKQVEE
jgi:hypothetical protein